MYIRSLLFALLIGSCNSVDTSDASLVARQDSLFRRDAPQVLAEIKRMVEADQAIRHLYDYGTTDPRVADSLMEQEAKMMEEGKTPENMMLQPGTPLYKFRVPAEARRFKDSVGKAMEAQDARHTARLVELISRYGYPSHPTVSTALPISTRLFCCIIQATPTRTL